MASIDHDSRQVHTLDNHGKVHLALKREWKQDIRGTFRKAAEKRAIEVMVSTIEYAIGIVDGNHGTQVLKDVIESR